MNWRAGSTSAKLASFRFAKDKREGEEDREEKDEEILEGRSKEEEGEEEAMQGDAKLLEDKRDAAALGRGKEMAEESSSRIFPREH